MFEEEKSGDRGTIDSHNFNNYRPTTTTNGSYLDDNEI